MATFRLETGESVIVHERWVRMELWVEPGDGDDTFVLSTELPVREPDGSYLGLDRAQTFECRMDEVVTIRLPDGGETLPAGEVSIRVIGYDGDAVTVDVAVPDGWVAVDAETARRDDYGV